MSLILGLALVWSLIPLRLLVLVTRFPRVLQRVQARVFLPDRGIDPDHLQKDRPSQAQNLCRPVAPVDHYSAVWL